MKTVALCALSFVGSTRLAAGVEPYTFPPLVSGDVDPAWFDGCRLLYIDLHGLPGQPFWHGDDGVIALTEEQLRRIDLSSVVVFALSCYLADTDSPMMDALLDSGARYVIGGTGKNYAVEHKLLGAAMLGREFCSYYRAGIRPLTALAIAKRVVALHLLGQRILGNVRAIDADRDTLAFKAYEKRSIPL